jgi:hypothetical protein
LIHLGATESLFVPAVLQIRQFVAEPEHVKHRLLQGEHYAAPVSKKPGFKKKKKILIKNLKRKKIQIYQFQKKKNICKNFKRKKNLCKISKVMLKISKGKKYIFCIKI